MTRSPRRRSRASAACASSRCRRSRAGVTGSVDRLNTAPACRRGPCTHPFPSAGRANLRQSRPSRIAPRLSMTDATPAIDTLLKNLDQALFADRHRLRRQLHELRKQPDEAKLAQWLE
ncbi:hypothetical protein, partial [Stutzerimonas kunmingensis]|uniref:hypothetical protein n=1 Tax=Stutzerimonas kunmingensis TaxID=1211807 RepID=UPI0035E41B1E